jgi:P27 family predicted phage terminase small subunit
MPNKSPRVQINADTSKSKISKLELRIRKETEKALNVKGDLACPKHMTSAAKKEWKSLMAVYRRMEVPILNDLDSQALMMYCEAVSVYKSAQDVWVTLDGRGILASNDEDQKRIDSVLKTMRDQSKIIGRLSDLLCLTPISRARMGYSVWSAEKKRNLLEDLLQEDE